MLYNLKVKLENSLTQMNVKIQQNTTKVMKKFK